MKKLPFWVNLLMAIAAGFLLVVALTYFLNIYTRHGKVTDVPDITKKNAREAISILKGRGFKVIVDSTYRDSLPPLYVIKQVPGGGEKVKQGRTIYLVVNRASIPLIDMPNLVGASVNSALHLLERANLKLGDTLYKPDFAAGRVLRQLLPNNEEVKPGTMIPYGTKITMIIGGGLGREIYNYPDFYGMTLKQALRTLDTLGLSPGAIVSEPGTKDTLNALVWKQYPPAIDPFSRTTTILRQGNVIDLWVSHIARAREVDTVEGTIDQSVVEGAEQQSLLEEKNAPKKAPLKKKKPVKPAATEPPKKPEAKAPGNDY
jgi:eukaryotic-like serine/threonine-protein kinase